MLQWAHHTASKLPLGREYELISRRDMLLNSSPTGDLEDPVMIFRHYIIDWIKPGGCYVLT